MNYEREYKPGGTDDVDRCLESSPLIQDAVVKNPPEDRRHRVFFIFGFLGLASLLPWNFFITAKEYFDYKFRNTSIVPFDDKNNSTRLQAEFESYLAIVSNCTNLLFMVITMLLVRSVQVKTRILVSIIIVVILFSVTTVLVTVDTDTWQDTFFDITMATAAGMSGVQSVLTGSVLGLSAMFPSMYPQSAMIGQAAGGTFSSLMSILTIATGDSPTTSALIYFLIAIGVEIVSIALYISLHFMIFSRYYMSSQVRPISKFDIELVERPQSRLGFYWGIFKKTWRYCTSVCLIFWVTLSVFPAVCSLIQSSQEISNQWTDTYFIPVVCFLLFNLGDFLGRLATFVSKYPGKNRPGALLVMSILRVGFIPLLMLCNAQPRYHLPVLLVNDAYPIIFITAMGLSNGYISTLAMSFGPLCVEDNELEAAGTMLALAMTVGLALGSAFSYLFVNLI